MGGRVVGLTVQTHGMWSRNQTDCGLEIQEVRILSVFSAASLGTNMSQALERTPPRSFNVADLVKTGCKRLRRSVKSETSAPSKKIVAVT